MFIKFLLAGIFFAAFPTTSNYQLNSYGFGSGGGANSTTSNYALEGISGEITGSSGSTATYTDKPAFIETQQANVPKISSFDNASSTYYNKLHFVIDQQSNPTDATYALQISTSSNFSSGIFYVKNDFSIGASLTTSDYMTYSTLGSSGGQNILGLTPNTTYYLRAKATQGKYTESGYGPSLSATTVNPSLTFSVSPTSIAFGSLAVGTVVNSPSNITVSFATNATSGGSVYINGTNNPAGLYSPSTSTTIPSATGDITSLSHGFGAQITANSQSSGGPFSKVSPYDLSSGNVGLIDNNRRPIFSSSALVTGGSGTVQLKAKASIVDPAKADYTETVTLIASASF